MTRRLLRCGRLANGEIPPHHRPPTPLPVCLPMSFNERADKQRGGGPEPGPFIITSPMITLFHPLYQINITRHGLDDLQSHLISLDTAFTRRGLGGVGGCLYTEGIAEWRGGGFRIQKGQLPLTGVWFDSSSAPGKPQAMKCKKKPKTKRSNSENCR